MASNPNQTGTATAAAETGPYRFAGHGRRRHPRSRPLRSPGRKLSWADLQELFFMRRSDHPGRRGGAGSAPRRRNKPKPKPAPRFVKSKAPTAEGPPK